MQEHHLHIGQWPTRVTLTETHMGMKDACAVIELDRDDEGVTITVRTPDGHSYPESASVRSVY